MYILIMSSYVEKDDFKIIFLHILLGRKDPQVKITRIIFRMALRNTFLHFKHFFVRFVPFLSPTAKIYYFCGMVELHNTLFVVISVV